MYTQAEIEQSYFEVTGNSLRSMVERMFDEFDVPTKTAPSKYATGASKLETAGSTGHAICS
jgi:hypothetical protein